MTALGVALRVRASKDGWLIIGWMALRVRVSKGGWLIIGWMGWLAALALVAGVYSPSQMRGGEKVSGSGWGNAVKREWAPVTADLLSTPLLTRGVDPRILRQGSQPAQPPNYQPSTL